MLIWICCLVKRSLQIGQSDMQQVTVLDGLDSRLGKHRGRVLRVRAAAGNQDYAHILPATFARDATHIESDIWRTHLCCNSIALCISSEHSAEFTPKAFSQHVAGCGTATAQPIAVGMLRQPCHCYLPGSTIRQSTAAALLSVSRIMACCASHTAAISPQPLIPPPHS